MDNKVVNILVTPELIKNLLEQLRVARENRHKNPFYVPPAWKELSLPEKVELARRHELALEQLDLEKKILFNNTLREYKRLKRNKRLQRTNSKSHSLCN